MSGRSDALRTVRAGAGIETAAEQLSCVRKAINASAVPATRRQALRYLQLNSRTSPSEDREHGGRGRIRTFVARKERQIYSLLVLATHPPVPAEVGRKSVSQKRLRAKRKRWVRKHKKDSCRKTPARQNLLPGYAPPHSPTQKSGGAGGGI